MADVRQGKLNEKKVTYYKESKEKKEKGGKEESAGERKSTSTICSKDERNREVKTDRVGRRTRGTIGKTSVEMGLQQQER